MKETLADGFTSYVDPPMDEKSIVVVSLVGVYCLEPQCMYVCDHGRIKCVWNLHQVEQIIILFLVKSILGRVCNTRSSETSLSGFDVTAWLQHLVLVPQMCSDRP